MCSKLTCTTDGGGTGRGAAPHGQHCQPTHAQERRHRDFSNTGTARDIWAI